MTWADWVGAAGGVLSIITLVWMYWIVYDIRGEVLYLHKRVLEQVERVDKHTREHLDNWCDFGDQPPEVVAPVVPLRRPGYLRVVEPPPTDDPA